MDYNQGLRCDVADAFLVIQNARVGLREGRLRLSRTLLHR